MEYNKRKHLKLLKSSQIPRRSLTDEEFVKFLDSIARADGNFFELEKYSAMMISHFHWENREHYFELIDKLLNGPIDFLELRKKYQSINETVESLEANLILLEPDRKSKRFGPKDFHRN